VATRTLEFDYDGHRLAYRVSGRGPVLVVIGQYWRKVSDVAAQLLENQYLVVQITPVGYGQSDRVPGFAGEALAGQVLAVLDHHNADRFVIWGYSAGGAMAACVARATQRAAGLVCGGFSLFDPLTPGTMRQLDRRLDSEHASRSLWPWVNSFDWVEELKGLAAPCLMYWGGDDRQMARKLRRSQAQLMLEQVDFVELPGLDHGACHSSDALRRHIVPTLKQWITRRLGPSW
jgi:pimeloyl-ACP methyl ester carboxylesterase